jgi:hypothetical protein
MHPASLVHREAGVAFSRETRMTPVRSMMTVLGIAALAMVALLVRQVEAAEKDDIAKIAAALAGGKADAAKTAAKKYAEDNKGIDDLMEGFGKKGLIADGIEKKLNDFQKLGATADDLKNSEYKEIGKLTAAVALVCDSLKAPTGKKGKPKEWTQFSADLKDKATKFQTAFNGKTPAAVKAAATALNDSCVKCHMKFK